ncbi:MAG: hypothetical protein EPO21_02695 [Chloroflexota bacterium]|nr:MAG: hypothetical protein EPO21_02695 [Chloroflexota bacterium]
MRVAILGTGNVGLACAADLTLVGHEIRLWGRERTELVGVLANAAVASGPGLIHLESAERHGDAHIAMVTLDIAAAVEGAEVIFVTDPAYTHDDITRAFAPHVRDGQMVAYLPANLSTPSAQRILEAAGVPGILLVEMAAPPYGTRRGLKGEAVIALRTICNLAAALPASRTNDAVAILQRIYPEIAAGSDILDVALVNPTSVIHPALVITNAGAIEHFGTNYDIHAQGTTAATLRLIYAVDAERIAVREALGYGEPHFSLQTYYDATRPGLRFFSGAGSKAVAASGLWRDPITMEHRYLREDVSYGLSLVSDLGRLVGVPTPMVDALIQIASILRGTDLRRRDRSTSALGLTGVSPESLRVRLR